ncbi:MAG: hypothetical protein AAGL49_10105, partial [Pseudomonadota bacterium]
FKQRRGSPRNLLLMDLVSKDTDNDGFLSCRDTPELFAYDLDRRRLVQIDLNGDLPATRRRFPWVSQLPIGIGTDANEDGFFDIATEPMRIGFFDVATLTVNDRPNKASLEGPAKDTSFRGAEEPHREPECMVDDSTGLNVDYR